MNTNRSINIKITLLTQHVSYYYKNTKGKSLPVWMQVSMCIRSRIKKNTSGLLNTLIILITDHVDWQWSERW